MSRRIPFRPSRALAVAIAIYLGLRALTLATAFDRVSVPIYELYKMGNIAELASSGWRGAPLIQFYDNCGGHLATGLFAAPLYFLLGSSYLVLKLVPVGLGLGTLVLGWRILERHFDRYAADVSALLFALAPPTLTKFSMLAMGNHFENLFFQFLVLFAFYRLHAGERKGLWSFALGAASGFAIFFYYGSAVMVGCVALVHVLVRGLRSLRDAAYALPGFALGFAPGVWILLETPAMLDFLADKSGISGGDGPLRQRAVWFFAEILPAASCFEDLGSLPGRIADLAWLAAFAVAWVVVACVVVARLARVPRDETGRFRALAAAPLLLYLPAVGFLVAAGNAAFHEYADPVRVGKYRYLVPHFAFATLLIGLAASALRSRGRSGALAGHALAGTAFACGLFTLPIVDWSFREPGAGLAYRGYDFRFYYDAALSGSTARPPDWEFEYDHDRLLRQVGDLPALWRHAAYLGIGHRLGWADRHRATRTGGGAATPRLDERLAGLPHEAWIDFAHGIGGRLRTERPVVVRAELAALGEAERLRPEWVAEGLGRMFEYPLASSLGRALARTRVLEPAIPAALRPAFARGRGMMAGKLLARGLRSDREYVRREASSTGSGAEGPWFWFGVGWGYCERRPDTEGAIALSGAVEEPWRGAALEGFGAAIRHLYSKESGDWLDAFDVRTGTVGFEALRRGVLWPSYPSPYPAPER